MNVRSLFPLLYRHTRSQLTYPVIASSDLMFIVDDVWDFSLTKSHRS